MRIQRLTTVEGDAVVARLCSPRELEGRYLLHARVEDPDRFYITASEAAVGYSALTGLDPKRGWITVLRDESVTVIMLGATVRPYE